MKSFITLIVCLLFTLSGVAQSFNLDLNARVIKNTGSFKKGDNVKLIRFVHATNMNEEEQMVESFYIVDSDSNKVYLNSRLDDCFRFHYKSIQDLWDGYIITNVLYPLKKNGYQLEYRQEMEQDALKYIYKVKSGGLEFNDPYLENYICSLIAKIAPEILIDGRPSNINILIMQDPSINASTFPNGTIVINTGLLASLHTEDELVAVLAHEIAHFILDHSVQNYNKMVSRQKRAEFWATLATGLTAVAEVAACSSNEYYVPGAATAAVALTSFAVAKQVETRLGMNYNHEQEREADMVAIEILKLAGYNKNALATALSRMEHYYILEKNNATYIDSYTHPSLIKRIYACGEPQQIRDKMYEQMVSFAVTNVATMKYGDRRFRQCLPYVSQNIDNGVATSDDYILNANCLLVLSNTQENNFKALDLVDKAKNLEDSNINVYKCEIIALLRLNRQEDAANYLKSYIDILNEMGRNIKQLSSDLAWEQHTRFVTNELSWATRMQIKLNGMYFKK